ncbi:hypothetical protein FNF27_04880 [Cafeteria roenbergensis]|uniref:Uncharacterized protein n=2 Tax=Cafeteria roenbergensis TaxID=33653 RepID=A0A5A8ECU9_CAFRO|nr:hypothetical protein FNF27_04880 [Cafeteria roenbergensis]
MDAVAADFVRMPDGDTPLSGATTADDEPEPRDIALFGPPPEHAADNSIRTTKYRWWSLLPLNLLEQFRRIANVYFLFISILMFVGTYFPTVFASPLSPWTTLGPLCLVLAISMAKEAYEDGKRGFSDRQVNNTLVPKLLGPRAADSTDKRERTGPDGSLCMATWADVRVGDVVLVRGGEPVPADMVLLQTSKPDGSCYVETSNIDGETDLKAKEAVHSIAGVDPSVLCGKHGESEPHMPSREQLNRILGLSAAVQCQAPNDKLYKFEGTITLPESAGDGIASAASVRASPGTPGRAKSRLGGTHVLTYTEMLLRGCTLRNTAWVLGAVVYTGRESKVMMKSGGSRAKLSATESTVNASVLVIFGCQVALCLVTTVAAALWEALYLDATESYLYANGSESQYIIPQWLGNFFTFLILFNNFIPISLYVTVEMVNYAQAALVDVDPDMTDPETGTQAKARTSNLNQDLGQVEFVFSDKTGTLTRNVMEFKACSVGGKAFGTVPALDGQWDDSAEAAVAEAQGRHGHSGAGRRAAGAQGGGKSRTSVESGASAGTDGMAHPEAASAAAVTPSRRRPGSGSPKAASADQHQSRYARQSRSVTQANPLGRGVSHGSARSSRSDAKPGGPTGAAAAGAGAASSAAASGDKADAPERALRGRSATAVGVSTPVAAPGVFFDEAFSESLAATGPESEAVVAFATIMAVCNTVVPEEVDSDDPAVGSRIEFQAESPDEGALVKAARCFGYELASRNTKGLTVTLAGPPSSRDEAGKRSTGKSRAAAEGTPVTFTRLGTHKFSSARKRMSVVVLDPRDKRCEGDPAVAKGRGAPQGAWLLCKGADNKMVDVADPSASELARKAHAVLDQHLTAFSERGLRTLVLGRRWMPWSEVTKWRKDFEAAERTVGGKDEALERVAEKYERDLELVGATAIEDKLQDGVPQTISDLARAGIKTWVLTGDKVETAINIGRTCKLLTDAMGEPMRVTATSREGVLEQLRAANAALDRFEQSAGADRTARPPSATDRDDDEDDRHRLAAGSSLNSVSVPGGKPVRTWGKRTPTPPTCWAHPSDRPKGCLGLVRRAWDMCRLGASWNCGDGGIVVSPEAAGRTRLPKGLVITGPALDFVLRRGRDPVTRRQMEPDLELEHELLDAAQRCQAVIACRVSPKQKADIVALVKHSRTTPPMTLAIGDGANDVGMIKAAQVGVGISGKEGLQAVNSADFAIAQFRFLKRLLLVHGRWSYRRMAKVLLYSFYKNVVITCTLFAYNAATGFSGTSFYESLVYSTFNFVLALPIIAVGIFDQDMDQDSMLAHPSVYVSGLRNLHLNVPKLTLWILHGFLHGAIIYAAVVLPFSLNAGPVWDPVSGLSDGRAVAGLSAFSAMCWAMQGKVALLTQHWTWIHVLMLVISQGGFFLFIGVYQEFPTFAPEFLGVATNAMGRPAFWFSSVLATAGVVIVDVVLETVRLMGCPTFIDVATERAGGIVDKDDAQARPWGDEGDVHPGGSSHARQLSRAKETHSSARLATQRAASRSSMPQRRPGAFRAEALQSVSAGPSEPPSAAHDAPARPPPAGETPDKPFPAPSRE